MSEPADVSRAPTVQLLGSQPIVKQKSRKKIDEVMNRPSAPGLKLRNLRKKRNRSVRLLGQSLLRRGYVESSSAGQALTTRDLFLLDRKGLSVPMHVPRTWISARSPAVSTIVK